MMRDAVPEFEKAVKDVKLSEPRVKVLSAVTAAPFDDIAAQLTAALTSPVAGANAACPARARRRAVHQGGPGRVLTGLVERTLRDVELVRASEQRIDAGAARCPAAPGRAAFLCGGRLGRLGDSAGAPHQCRDLRAAWDQRGLRSCSRTGVHERPIAGPDDRLTEYAARTATPALEGAGLEPADVDLLIVEDPGPGRSAAQCGSS